jgi:hypothetical protein
MRLSLREVFTLHIYSTHIPSEEYVYFNGGFLTWTSEKWLQHLLVKLAWLWPRIKPLKAEVFSSTEFLPMSGTIPTLKLISNNTHRSSFQTPAVMCLLPALLFGKSGRQRGRENFSQEEKHSIVAINSISRGKMLPSLSERLNLEEKEKGNIPSTE